MDGSTYQIEAYLSDGTFLWSKDLGQGIEPGVWYSPFIAYDFNGDGKAEIALKTAPETTKRNEKGRVDSGEEYLSVWDGTVSYTHLIVSARLYKTKEGKLRGEAPFFEGIWIIKER